MGFENQVIWLIGSSGCGKTSQARKLHSFFQAQSGIKSEPYLIKGIEDGVEYKYSKMSLYSAHIGDLVSQQQCAGTDSLKNKQQLELTVQKAKQGSNVIIIDGIMATGQWIDILKNEKTEVLLYHLKISFETNMLRLRQRRANKKNISPEQVIITSETELSLKGKIKGFQSLYNRMWNLVDHAVEIDTENKSIETIHKEIVNHYISTL